MNYQLRLTLFLVFLLGSENIFAQGADLNQDAMDISDLTYQYPYSEKAAKVMKNGKWGFINVGGKVKIPLKYDDVSSFLYGVSRVQRGTKFSAIDFTGKQIMPWFDYVYPYYNGIAKVKNRNEIAFVDRTGKLVSDWFDAAYVYYYGLTRVKKGHKWAFMNNKGKVVTDWYFEADVLDKKIKFDVISDRYDVKTVAILNEKGEEITERFPSVFYTKRVPSTSIFDSLKYDQVIATSNHTLFTEGISIIKNDNAQFAYQNDAGIQITEWLMEAENYYEGVARMVNLEGKMAYLGSNGKQITPWVDRVFPFFNRLAILENNGKYIFIDKTGEYKTDWFDYASQFSDGLAKVCLEKKWGYIDSRGKLVINLIYDDAMSFSYGYAQVEIDGKHLIINKQNKAMHGAFDHVYRFTDSIAAINLAGFYAYIDRSGTRITPWLEGASDFSFGLARVVLDGKIALINNKGKVVTPWYEKAFLAPPNLVLGDTLPHGKVGRYILLGLQKYDNYFSKYPKGVNYDKFYQMSWNYTDREPPLSWNDGFFKESIHPVYKPKDNKLSASSYSEVALADYNDKPISSWYHEIYKSDDGLIVAQRDLKYVLLNIYGEEISKQYDGIYYHQTNEIMVQLDEKFSFIDRKDTVLTEWYEDISDFNEGYSVVKKDGKYGLMTEQFDVISDWYDYMDNEFSYNMRRVKVGDNWGAITKEGFDVIEPKYQNADFINGFLRVKSGDDFLLFDINGNLIKTE